MPEQQISDETYAMFLKIPNIRIAELMSVNKQAITRNGIYYVFSSDVLYLGYRLVYEHSGFSSQSWSALVADRNLQPGDESRYLTIVNFVKEPLHEDHYSRFSGVHTLYRLEESTFPDTATEIPGYSVLLHPYVPYQYEGTYIDYEITDDLSD